MTIEVYTFVDAEDQEWGFWHTQDYKEAEEYARSNKLKIIANTFEWSDSEVAEDFTESEEVETP